MDQTVAMARVPTDPRSKGNRLVYWSLNEVDYSEAFGYEETKDLPYDETVDTLEDMGVENPDERAEEFGKDPKLEKSKSKGSFVNTSIPAPPILPRIKLSTKATSSVVFPRPTLTYLVLLEKRANFSLSK